MTLSSTGSIKKQFVLLLRDGAGKGGLISSGYGFELQGGGTKKNNEMPMGDSSRVESKPIEL
jgi:hypothetical protein